MVVLESVEDARHDVLLIIITGLFILFATGIAIPLKTPVGPIVVPPA